MSGALGSVGGGGGARAQAFLGVPLERHETIGSTNDEAFRRAGEGAAEGLVVVASVQTSGRGRQGRLWWDAPNLSLSFSILLRPNVPLPQYPLVAVAIACAVADAGGEISGAALQIKWPNDVVHSGKKLCGVLAESRVGGGSRDARLSGGSRDARLSGGSRDTRLGGIGAEVAPLILGVGVNVNQAEEDFPRELRGAATSLRLLRGGGDSLSLDATLVSILARFEPYARMAQSGDAASLHAAVAPRLPQAGAEVSVRSGERRIDGIVEGITETGALRVRERGREEATIVSAGEIQ
ncbi:MAG: biotin--[acetyl-CoA-carboxylase] ligase [Candidatus Eiseniibacteriota bacterium]